MKNLNTPDPEPPCVGLDPDTYECPLCGATIDEACRATLNDDGVWQVPPAAAAAG